MNNQFLPITAISKRSRRKAERLKPRITRFGDTFTVAGSKGAIYTVTMRGYEFSCNCLGATGCYHRWAAFCRLVQDTRIEALARNFGGWEGILAETARIGREEGRLNAREFNFRLSAARVAAALPQPVAEWEAAPVVPSGNGIFACPRPVKPVPQDDLPMIGRAVKPSERVRGIVI